MGFGEGEQPPAVLTTLRSWYILLRTGMCKASQLSVLLHLPAGWRTAEEVGGNVLLFTGYIFFFPLSGFLIFYSERI